MRSRRLNFSNTGAVEIDAQSREMQRTGIAFNSGKIILAAVDIGVVAGVKEVNLLLL